MGPNLSIGETDVINFSVGETSHNPALEEVATP